MKAERLAEALGILGWTQRVMAGYLAISPRMVRHYLSGRTAISTAHAELVEQAMGAVTTLPAARLKAALRALGLGLRAGAVALEVPRGELRAMLAGDRIVPAAVRQRLRAMF
jgi:plasmid maintenance system antidote protein VapI